MDYKKLLEETTSLKPASIKLYSIKLKQLDKELGNNDNNLNYLLNTKNVMDYIVKLNSTDDKLATLNSILKVIKNDKATRYYQKVRNDLNKVKFDTYKNNTKCDEFVDYKILLDATPAPDFNSSVEQIINDMMLYISIRHPMRLILWDINIVRNKNLMTDTNKNYLYITNNSMSFVLNNFKNVGQMGQQTVKVFDNDAKIIRSYIK